MMKIKDLNKYFNILFPYSDIEPWDQVGLYRQKFKNSKIHRVIVALDLTTVTIHEAIKEKANLIICHHPLFIDKKNIKEKYNKKINDLLNEHKISVICLHTNYDRNKKGMNYRLAKKLGGTRIRKAFTNSFGNLFSFKEAIDEATLFNHFKKLLHANFIISDHHIRRHKYKNIYICGGAGGSEIETIIKQNKKIDCFISGDIKWHLWNLAHAHDVKIFDVGHNIENIFIYHISDILNKIQIENKTIDKLHLSIV
ncbi:MAG: Nif3-like dinuclear metal center hexameric protein [Mycoplasmoidaceae bacterium]